VESYSHDESGFTVGAELSAGFDWRAMPNLTIGSGVKVSWQQDVTGFRAAESPDSQPAGFYEEDIYRVFVDILRIKGTF
jgi:hypothetical protein